MALVATQLLRSSKQLGQVGYKGFFSSFNFCESRTSISLVSVSGRWNFLVCVALLEAGWVAGFYVGHRQVNGKTSYLPYQLNNVHLAQLWPLGKKTGCSHWLLRLTWGLLVSWGAWNEKVPAWNWRTIVMGNPSASRESCTSEGWGFHKPFFSVWYSYSGTVDVLWSYTTI